MVCMKLTKKELEKRIVELEAENRLVKDLLQNRGGSGPNIETCQHEYPSPWFGIVPPSCTKCGKSSSGLSTRWFTGTIIDGVGSVKIG